MAFPNPRWLDDMEEGPDKERARTRFVIRLAAMYYSPTGFTNELSVAVDLTYNTLGSGANRWTAVPAEIAWKIQELLGEELFPASLLNPIFARTE